MLLSRGGLELTEIWARQASIVEADAEGRELERKVHADPGDEQARQAALAHYRRRGPEGHAGLIRLGASGEVMAHLVREHARHHRADPYSQESNEARWAIRRHHGEHGDHPADHVRREEGETPRQFGNRLVGFNLANSTVRPAGTHASEHDHGMLTYSHDAEDEHGHGRNAQAMRRAWEREVPEGHAQFHHKTTGEGAVRGSVVSFRTGPRPQQHGRR